MSQSRYDAVVIGGGPGGSTAATFLARGGRRVLLLERERFPRFRIGESLLPYNRRLFEEMGVLPALEAAGFPAKLGAQFHLGNGSKSLKLRFANGRFTREPRAFQVERAVFDQILLRHAADSGVRIVEGWTATRFERTAGSVRVYARPNEAGSDSVEGFEAPFLVDASGRANLTGNQEGLRVIHPHLRKVAVFGHFEGVERDAGSAGADTVIVRSQRHWFWLIPLNALKTSVGCVLDSSDYAAMAGTPEERFERLWRATPEMTARMRRSSVVAGIQTTADFSYYNRSVAGPRLFRVGDAAGFMDPIFSAGVYLAMYSGKLAAEAIDRSLAGGDDGGARVPQYEREVFRAMRYYWDLVEGFYRSPFLELLMEPRSKFKLPDAITAILAGELHGGWKIRWRRRLFMVLARLQEMVPVVPRIDWEAGAPKPPVSVGEQLLNRNPAKVE